MNPSFFIILLFALQSIYWWIGKWSSKQIREQKDYFLSGKNVGSVPLAMTFIGTLVGGGLVLGAADAAFQYGWWVLFYPLGTSLGFLALALGIGKRLADFGVSTIAQILEVAYQSPALKKLVSCLSILSLFMVLAAQVLASYKFFIALGFTNPIFFILFWGTIIFYTVQGGFRAVVATNAAQTTVFSLIFLGCFVFLLCKGSLPSLNLSPSSFALSSSKLTGWLLMPLLYMMIEQDIGQCCFAGKSSRTIAKAAFWAGIGTMAISMAPIAFGILAAKAKLDIPSSASTLMTAVLYATNPFTTALVGCAVLATIVSTSTSLINAISSNLSQDFDLFLNQSNLKTPRLLTLGIAIGALIISFYFNDVITILIQSYELFVSAVFIPVLIALFKKRGYFLSALLSILFGIGSFIIFKIIYSPFPAEITNIFISLMGYCVGELIALFQNRRFKHAA